MFPCSSIYQNFPVTNQNTMACKQLEIIEDHDHGYQNPNHDHQDPNSNQEYYSQLPTIFEDDGLMLSHLLSQKQLLMASATTTTTTNSSSTTTYSSHDNVNITGCPSKGFSKKKQIARGGDTNKKTVNNPRRRTGKKDRHSKISTAQGLRDRRMRLSLQIARKFFDLQDMLRFDKASKTIEWLFNKSKTAIRELKASLTKRSSCSNHDTDDDEEEEDADDDDDQILMRNISMPAKEIKKKNSVKKLHNFKVAKESRDKARARARERTREKNMLQNSTQTAQMPLKNIMVADDEALEHHHDADLVSTHEKFQAETNVADYYSTMMSSSSGAHYEDDFLGLFPPGNWELINSSSKPQSFCHMNYKPVLISSTTTTTTTDIQEEKPSSIFRTSTANTSSREENPSSVFMAAAAAQYYHEAEDPNPNHDPVFISSTTTTLVSHIQDQNLPGSNVFYSTVNF